MNVRILIAEDHTMVRQALRRHLEAQPGFELVGEAGDGLAALRLVEKHRPDVLLLDLVMPGLAGMGVLDRVAERFQKTRVVILSMRQDKGYVMKALMHGAWGYVRKHADTAELIAAIQQVARGEKYLCAPYSWDELETYVKKAKGNDRGPYEMLTAREKEVLQLLAEGLTNPAVGRKLFINTRTVESHRAHIMEKLNLNNFAALVRFAIAHGLVEAEPPPAHAAGNGLEPEVGLEPD